MPFTYYDEKPNTKPTTQEILAALTSQQKADVLNGFADNIPAVALKYIAHVPTFAIRHLYRKIDEIEEQSRALMRGEVLVTPEVVDEQTGEVITPAVYNTPPADSAELLAAVQDDFSDDFSSAQVTAILTKMVNYSKHDGTGNWAYYAAEVVA
jgi:hypothetical protein